MGEAGRSFVLRQMTWCSLGLVLMAVFLLFDYRILERWALWIYIIVVAALIAVWAVATSSGYLRPIRSRGAEEAPDREEASP